MGEIQMKKLEKAINDFNKRIENGTKYIEYNKNRLSRFELMLTRKLKRIEIENNTEFKDECEEEIRHLKDEIDEIKNIIKIVEANVIVDNFIISDLTTYKEQKNINDKEIDKIVNCQGKSKQEIALVLSSIEENILLTYKYLLNRNSPLL